MKQEHENYAVLNQYCGEQMQIFSQSLQPAMWANLLQLSAFSMYSVWKLEWGHLDLKRTI